MLSRRESLGTDLAAAASAYAMPGDKFRYAMSGHECRKTPPHPDTGIKMTAQYGYHGLEPFQEDIAKYLDKPPAALKEVLDASGLALCTVGSGGQYLDPAKVPQTIDDNVARCRYIQAFGCDHLKVNMSRRVGDGSANLSADDAKALARTLNEIGKRAMGETGIKFGFHPHCWTLIERQPELDR